MPSLLSIVIVNYKTSGLILDCIRSIKDNTSVFPFEIIIVDNHSQDNSKSIVTSEFNDIIWIDVGYNAGFAKANNIGIKNAQGEYILLLNPDTLILPQAIDKSMAFFIENEQNLNLGLLGCKLLNKDLSLQFSASSKFLSIRKLVYENDLACFVATNFLNRKFSYATAEFYKHSHITSWLCGAFLLLNSKLCKEDNIWLDEDFFMYSEDVEWCNRISKKYNIYFYSEASIIHLSGAASTINSYKIGQILLSEWLFIMKSRGKIYFAFYYFLELLNVLISPIFLKNKSIDHLDIIKLKKILLKHYFWKILVSFKSSPSTSNQSLVFNYKLL